MELASSLVVGAKTDFIDLIYNFVVFIFQVTFSTWTSDNLHVLFCLWPNNSGLKILLWIFDIQATDVTGHCEAYHTLSRILQVWIRFLAHLNYHLQKLLLCRLSSFFFFFLVQEHAWFCSSRFVELIDLLLGLKSPDDVATLKNRFACFHILIVHALEVKISVPTCLLLVCHIFFYFYFCISKSSIFFSVSGIIEYLNSQKLSSFRKGNEI